MAENWDLLLLEKEVLQCSCPPSYELHGLKEETQHLDFIPLHWLATLTSSHKPQTEWCTKARIFCEAFLQFCIKLVTHL